MLTLYSPKVFVGSIKKEQTSFIHGYLMRNKGKIFVDSKSVRFFHHPFDPNMRAIVGSVISTVSKSVPYVTIGDIICCKMVYLNSTNTNLTIPKGDQKRYFALILGNGSTLEIDNTIVYPASGDIFTAHPEYNIVINGNNICVLIVYKSSRSSL